MFNNWKKCEDSLAYIFKYTNQNMEELLLNGSDNTGFYIEFRTPSINKICDLFDVGLDFFEQQEINTTHNTPTKDFGELMEWMEKLDKHLELGFVKDEIKSYLKKVITPPDYSQAQLMTKFSGTLETKKPNSVDTTDAGINHTPAQTTAYNR